VKDLEALKGEPEKVEESSDEDRYLAQNDGSSILQKGDVKLLRDWLGDGNDLMKGQKERLNMLLRYRATRDGWNDKDFWDKCGGLGNCFVFARSTLGKRFGGFRALKFDKNKGGY
jgi:hypothetical protein